jgi:hypothetical protein
MSGLRSGLEELRGDELATVGDLQLHADVLELASVEEMARAERLRRLAEIDRRGSVEERGYLSTAAWLRDKARWDGRSAHREVGTARALEEMPLTAAAHRNGAIGSSHIKVLVRAARDQSEAYGEAEETLVDAACTLTPRQLARLVDYWTQNLDPETSIPMLPSGPRRPSTHDVGSTSRPPTRAWFASMDGSTGKAAPR